MKKILFLLLFTSSSICFSQQSPGFCDSMIIDSIQFQAGSNNTISLQATNLSFSFDLVSYPGFILYNSNGDTIAKENVNYFGIGSSPQTHLLQIINNPVSLPMNGSLELYSGFYDSLRCTFQITLNDTIANLFNELNTLKLGASPNPSSGRFIINGITENSYNSIIITDQKGRNINPIIKNGNEVDLSNQKSGIYFLTIQQQGTIKRLKLIKL